VEPKFEVASINPSSPDSRLILGPALRNGTLKASNVSLKQILAAAYGLAGSRVIGPDWLDKDRFDLLGKSPEGVPDSEIKPMLQALLEERFQLAAHREKSDMPVYDLVVAKGGIKMSVYPASELPSVAAKAPGFPMMRGTATMSQLADMLAATSGRPVLDRTGLSGRYNFLLIYTPVSLQVAGGVPEFAPPDLFTAVQEQLGLKLQPNKETIDVVVIDHIERRPSANQIYGCFFSTASGFLSSAATGGRNRC
jgi:uncharacterized protein (TIGR03435 family)